MTRPTSSASAPARSRRPIQNGPKAAQVCSQFGLVKLAHRVGVGAHGRAQVRMGVPVHQGEDGTATVRAHHRFCDGSAYGECLDGVQDGDLQVGRHSALGEVGRCIFEQRHHRVSRRELDEQRGGIAMAEDRAAQVQTLSDEPVLPEIGADAPTCAACVVHDALRDECEDLSPIVEVVVQGRRVDSEGTRQAGQGECVEAITVDELECCSCGHVPRDEALGWATHAGAPCLVNLPVERERPSRRRGLANLPPGERGVMPITGALGRTGDAQCSS